MSRQQVLEDVITRHGWVRGAELGVFKGETLFYLLDNIPKLHMIGVDSWERAPGSGEDRETGHVGREDLPMEIYAQRVLAQAEGYRGRCKIHYGKSCDAAADVADQSLDFVFIDAAHDTASVIADIRAWRPKIRAGGALLGHDINWPSVERAVRQALPSFLTLDANIWMYQV